MFANLCFQVLDYFSITTNETLKMMIAVFLALLVFGVFYFVVKFTGLEINNLNQNILALLTVDIISFAYLMYKRKQELNEKLNQQSEPLEPTHEQPQEQSPEQPQEQPQEQSPEQSQEQPQEQPQEQSQEQSQEQQIGELPQNIEEKIKEIVEEENVNASTEQ